MGSQETHHGKEWIGQEDENQSQGDVYVVNFSYSYFFVVK
jgi:hypothetical protein